MFLPCPSCGFLVALIAPRSGASQRCPRCGANLPSPDEAYPADPVHAPSAATGAAIDTVPQDDVAPVVPGIAPLLAVHALDVDEPAADGVLNPSGLPGGPGAPSSRSGGTALPAGAKAPAASQAEVPLAASRTPGHGSVTPEAGAAGLASTRLPLAPTSGLSRAAPSPVEPSQVPSSRADAEPAMAPFELPRAAVSPAPGDPQAARPVGASAASTAPGADATLRAAATPSRPSQARLDHDVPAAPAGELDSLTLEPYDVAPYVAGASSDLDEPMRASASPGNARRSEPLTEALQDAGVADDGASSIELHATPGSDTPDGPSANDTPTQTATPLDSGPEAVTAAPPASTPRRHTPRFARRSTTGKHGKRRVLGGLCAALALLLGLQLALAQRAELASDARTRPAIATLCAVLRCTLPPWHEPTALAMLERNVLPSRTKPGVLEVDAHFRNDARWPQAWPVLVLTLSDVEGQPLGARAFRPAEYLPRNAATELAPGRSARVHFEVREPAPGVVAFTFDFR